MFVKGSLLAALPEALSAEMLEELHDDGKVRIERIVSRGQASPAGFWYDQEENEFVVLLKGEALLRFAGVDDPVVLEPGDYLKIPAHCRHRIDWTPADQDTVWLAFFY